jgi:HK97 family phage prohead protease
MPEILHPALRTIDTAKIEYRSFLMTRDAIKDDGTFEGMASAFGIVDSYGTQWRAGSWVRGGLKPDNLYALLFMHSPYDPVGVFGGEEREDGLWIAGQFDETDEGIRARIRAKSGSAAELSVGFILRDTDPDDESIFTSTELVEVSQITRNFAAQPGAALTAVRAKQAAEVAQRDRNRRLAIARLRIS